MLVQSEFTSLWWLNVFLRKLCLCLKLNFVWSSTFLVFIRSIQVVYLWDLLHWICHIHLKLWTKKSSRQIQSWMGSCRVEHGLLCSLQAVQFFYVHLLLFDLCVLLNLLAIKQIIITIRSLYKTPISIYFFLLWFHTIATDRKTCILPIFLGYLLTIFHSNRLLGAQVLLIPRLTTHSTVAISLRSVHKTKLAWSIVVDLSISSASCGLTLQLKTLSIAIF